MMNGVGDEGIGESTSCSTDVNPDEAGVGDMMRDVLATDVEPNLENHRRIPTRES